MRMMFFVCAALLATTAHAQKTTNVDGYFKGNGTYVAPHTRTTPNSTTNDNYGTKGNFNPYSGKEGTKSSQ